MCPKDNSYFLKDQHLSAFSSKGQVKVQVPPFKVSPDQSPRISDHVEEPSRYFTPILRPQSVACDVTWQVVKPVTRHVNVVAPLQYPGRKILHPVPGFLRRHLASGNNSGNYQSRLPPKKRRFIDEGEGDGPSAKVSKGVSSETMGFSHNENSLFSAYRRPSVPTTPQTNGVTFVQPSGQTLDAQNDPSTSTASSATAAHARDADQNDIEASDDDDGEVTDIIENVQPGLPLARQNETTVTHAQDNNDEYSDEDSEIAEIMENAGNKEYPILGYRVVMLTPGDDEYETDDDEYDAVVDARNDGYSTDGSYQDDDGYEGDDDSDDYNNDDDTEIMQLMNNEGCQSPREPWLSMAINTNNSRAGSENMDDVMMDCFRPITPVVIRFSPDSRASDQSTTPTPSVTESNLSLSQFSPIAVSSSSTIGTLSDDSTPPSVTESKLSLSQFSPISISSTSTIGSISDYSMPPPDRSRCDTDESTLGDEGCESTEITDEKGHMNDLSADAVGEDRSTNDLIENDEGLIQDNVTTNKPLLAVNPSTSLKEFRASVLTGEKLSLRRYEEWFTKSEDEQFAEILEDFLEENEGNIVDEDMIRGMLADTRDRIAEKRKTVREAREPFNIQSTSRGTLSEVRVTMSSRSSGSTRHELMDFEGDDVEESSSEENVAVEPSTSGEKLCRHISSFFGHSGCAAYISYCRRELQTYADQDFYNMFSERESPANEDVHRSNYSDDSQVSSHYDHNYCLSSYPVSSLSDDDSDIIVID